VALRQAEAHNALLEEKLENVKGLLKENADEMERLKEIVEERGGEDTFNGGNDGVLKRRVEDLEAENTDLHSKLTSQTQTQTLDEKEDLADKIEALRLNIEELHRRRDAESVERSQSRARILIELQKEEEVELKEREIEELVGEYNRIVEVVEREWRGEVEEARGQVEELRDVSAFFHFGAFLLDT
jgi:hypothetical protein